jgi:hypothetical protein
MLVYQPLVALYSLAPVAEDAFHYVSLRFRRITGLDATISRPVSDDIPLVDRTAVDQKDRRRRG